MVVGKKHFLEFLFSAPFSRGVMAYSARYLGARTSCFGNSICERQQRVHSMKRGYAEMGSFWASSNSETAIRNVFVARVVSHAVSGLSAFALTSADRKMIEHVLCRLLRKAISGKAVEKQSDGRAVCSLSNRELLGRYGIARHHVEVRVQRLLMFQCWSLHPDEFRQPIAVLFGRWHLPEMSEFNEHGQPAHSFVQGRAMDTANNFGLSFAQ